ncbi:FAD-dependent monooxygenase [Streptomyces sp. NPDC047000]|uniref:FAD-dependent monooxygenase n=1 Tax=Streptomyces sp. NPDC047000 TaxID=3155474 RepID=UPI0033D1D8FE
MKALVIGAGIGGLTCAVALRRVGIDVEVYERAGELREAGSGLSVMSNAVTALTGFGIDLGLDKRGQSVESFRIMDRRGRRIRDLPFPDACERAGAPSYCLSRSDLQEALLAEAGDCPVHLGATAAGFETGRGGVTVRFTDGRSAAGDLLIGADGINSAVRRHLTGPEPVRESGYFFRLGIVPFRHPCLTTGAVRHYWGTDRRFGLIDIGHGRCYWWAALSTSADPAGGTGAAAPDDRAKDTLVRAFDGWADEVRAVIEATPPADILTVPSRDRAFLERWGEGPVTLLGDAAHPMLTTLAQGAGMAMEDAVVLARTLAAPATGDDPARALRAYEDRRRDRTRATVLGSRTMSDLTQGARLRERLGRQAYFRLMPGPALTRQTVRALTFPDDGTSRTGTVRRPLSPLERLYWIADRTSPLNVIARARVHGDLPPALHRRCLDVLQLRHPLLRVAITDDGTGAHPAFVPLDGRQIPLRHVHVPPDDPAAGTRWERETDERELAERLDWRTGPLLRAVVVTSEETQGSEETNGEDGRAVHPAGHRAVHDLLLTASHIIADGKTCLSLVREWTELAAQLDRGTLPAAAPRRALPATDDLLPRRHRGAAGVAAFEALMRREQRAARRRPAQRIVPSHQVPFDRRRTRMLHRRLTAGQLELLVRAARRHGATVHGVLAAAMVTAVARDAGAPAGTYVSIGSPVDFRADLEPPVAPDEAGTYVATVPSRVRYEPGRPLWTVARAVSQDLVRRKRRREHLATISLPRSAGPWSLADSEPFMRFMDEKGPINLCLSNVGRYDFPDRVGPWRVSGAQFLTGVSVMGAMVATATTSHDELAWNFGYIDDLIPASRARRIADDSVHTVLSALAE